MHRADRRSAREDTLELSGDGDGRLVRSAGEKGRGSNIHADDNRGGSETRRRVHLHRAKRRWIVLAYRQAHRKRFASLSNSALHLLD